MARKYKWSDIGKLPTTPGVYMYGCGEDVYIGHSGNIRQRVRKHRSNGVDACFIKTIPTNTKKQARDLERELIGKMCPPQNTLKPQKCNTSFWDEFFS